MIDARHRPYPNHEQARGSRPQDVQGSVSSAAAASFMSRAEGKRIGISKRYPCRGGRAARRSPPERYGDKPSAGFRHLSGDSPTSVGLFYFRAGRQPGYETRTARGAFPFLRDCLVIATGRAGSLTIRRKDR